MNNFQSFSIFLLLILSCVLYFKLRKNRRLLARANRKLICLGEETLSTLKKDAENSKLVQLTVKIHDPMSVAKKESMPAQLIGDFIPEVITKKVYQELKKELAKSLEEKEIEAEIKIETL